MVNDANALANGEKQDSCPKGYGCATYGKPDIGHCCKLYCPYGSADLTKSCEAGAGSNKCPDTHYCQSFEDRGTKKFAMLPKTVSRADPSVHRWKVPAKSALERCLQRRWPMRRWFDYAMQRWRLHMQTRVRSNQQYVRAMSKSVQHSDSN
jgi:hypothetical protein